MSQPPTNSDMAILYIGAFAPDRPEYRTGATSTAGNLFQANFLRALADSSLPTPTILSYFPVPSFPKSRKLFHRSVAEKMANGLEVRSLAHLNLGAIKILTLGASAAWNALRWGWQNHKAAKRVVICYNLTAPPAGPLVTVCRWLGMDLVPFIGDIYVPGEVVSNTLLRRLEFAGQKRIIPKADGLLIANRAIVQDFAPDRHSLLIEGGVMDALVTRFAATPRMDDGTFHVVFAGQLSVLNGVTLLIDALKQLDLPNLRVSILGGGEFARQVEEAAANEPRITFHGLATHDKVLEVYESADLLVNLRRTNYQTHRYVFPSKVVECLSTGRPLLTTCTGHAQSDFGEFVFTLHDETPEGLATAIREIAALDPAERTRKGKLAQDYVRENKTWEAHTRRLEAYLNEHVFNQAA
jgi:glycosyltransferase involved in cell wall biosynthesis